MILLVSGSPSPQSSNTRLLKGIAKRYNDMEQGLNFTISMGLQQLPLFSPELDDSPWPDIITDWRQSVRDADAIIFSTPVYIFNIPAALKNALEWLTTSGELQAKPVLAMTYTPHPPRGEKAMSSLLQSLKALNARIIGQCSIYQSELTVDDNLIMKGEESISMLSEGIRLLI